MKSNEELMELQLDYWLADKIAGAAGGRTDIGDKKFDSEKSKKQQDPKSSIRTTFRSLVIRKAVNK